MKVQLLLRTQSSGVPLTISKLSRKKETEFLPEGLTKLPITEEILELSSVTSALTLTLAEPLETLTALGAKAKLTSVGGVRSAAARAAVSGSSKTTPRRQWRRIVVFMGKVTWG